MDHTDIVRICADDFARFGDTFEGAGWTKTEEEADRRYAVMLDLMPASERFARGAPANSTTPASTSRRSSSSIAGTSTPIERSTASMCSTAPTTCRCSTRSC